MEPRRQPIHPPTNRPFLVLDTETTGLNPPASELLSIAIVDSDGRVLLDTYLTPEHNTDWEDAEAIHGISPDFIFSGNFPQLSDIKPQLVAMLQGKDVVMYNAGFDCGFLADVLTDAGAGVYDVMEPFAEWFGDWSDYWQSNKWQKLTTAASCVRHAWKADAHSALGDALATLDVWVFLTDVNFYNAVQEQKRREQEDREVTYVIDELIRRDAEQERQVWREAQKRSDELIRRAMHVWDWVEAYRVLDKASASAHIFCLHLTGYSLSDWEAYGEYRLNLPRVTKADKPDHLYLATDVYFFKTGNERPKPVMMMNRKKKVLDLVGLYDLRQLVVGVDYVFWSSGAWPEGCYSETSLKKQFKLKPKQIQAMKPAYMRIGYKFNYLLYVYIPLS